LTITPESATAVSWPSSFSIVNKPSTWCAFALLPAISMQDRHACKYLRIEADAARVAGKAAALLPSITCVLDNALAALNQPQ
jgi:hypothetical protein